MTPFGAIHDGKPVAVIAIPTVSTAIEITTSSSETPSSACLRT